MKELHFGIDIAAPVARVWDCTFDPIAYRDWTRAFCEGSYYEGSWREGARLRFLDPDGNGMEGIVDACLPPQRLTLRLVGSLTGGRPTPDSRYAREPAFERYEFSVTPGGTLLDIRLQGWDDSVAAMLADSWPRALQRLKALAESTH